MAASICEHLRQKFGIEETSNPLQASVDISRGFTLTFQCYWEIFVNITSTRNGTNQINTTTSNLFEQFGEKLFANDARLFFDLDPNVILTVMAFAIVWTLARHFLVSHVFRPGARWSGVHEKNVEKLGEAAWKTFAYFVMWSYCFYVTFFRGYDYFYEPMQQFSDWAIDKAPPGDLSLAYALEFSFYFHCIYATLYMDAWRKDSLVMLTHHFVTMTLVGFSYLIRCVKIGVLIFTLNDIADVLLEAGKVCTYLRHRSSGFSRFFSKLSDIIAVLFALNWLIGRLFFHLTKVWRSGSFGTWTSFPLLPLPFHFFLNIFLATLYFFYLYWFWFILVFVARVIRGKGSGSAEDPREDESASESGTPRKKVD